MTDDPQNDLDPDISMTPDSVQTQIDELRQSVSNMRDTMDLLSYFAKGHGDRIGELERQVFPRITPTPPGDGSDLFTGEDMPEPWRPSVPPPYGGSLRIAVDKDGVYHDRSVDRSTPESSPPWMAARGALAPEAGQEDHDE